MATDVPDVSVVVISYNTRDLLASCLTSVLDQVAPDLAIEMFVVDNASADGSAEMVARSFPLVRLIALPTNLGFGRAVNLAAGEAAGRFLLLLNPDSRVLPGSVRALVAFASAHQGHGVYGGRTFTDAGEPDPRSCWGLPTVWSLLCFATGLSTMFPRSALFNPESLGRWERDSVREVGVVSGCLMLTTRQLWRELGGFDPAYFMYSEDVDICIRARRLGYRPVVVPEARVAHVGGASSATRADKVILVLKGKATLLRRLWSPWRRRTGLTLLGVGVGLRAAGAAVTGGRRGEWWLTAWHQRKEWMRGYDDPIG